MGTKKRGRPPGRTEEGEETRRALYRHALQLLAERGYDGMTMRALAERAGVSPGLCYRYFPSKGAIVMALYGDLSARFAATPLPDASWTERTLVALRASLTLLEPHRDMLAGALQVLLLDDEVGLFASASRDTRSQVQGVFVAAVTGARDAPRPAAALGRIADLVQLALILWLILDRSPVRRATWALVDLTASLAPLLRVAVRVPGVPAFLERLDVLAADALGAPVDAPVPIP